MKEEAGPVAFKNFFVSALHHDARRSFNDFSKYFTFKLSCPSPHSAKIFQIKTISKPRFAIEICTDWQNLSPEEEERETPDSSLTCARLRIKRMSTGTEWLRVQNLRLT